MKVIDSFIFFNELEMLKLRLNYLNEVVDYFIICESNYTHSGKSKPYYLEEILPHLSQDIASKIIRLKYEPDINEFNFLENTIPCDLNNDYWTLERNQRNLITQNLHHFSTDDFLMISDLDEIPRKEIIQEYKDIFETYIGNALPVNFSCVLKCDMFYYNFKTFCGDNWYGTVFSNVGTVLDLNCDYFRQNRHHFFPVSDGGWHFSTFGDVNRIRTKIQSFAHQEYNREEYINDLNIQASIQNKEDLYHNSAKFKDYSFLNLPEDIRNHIIKFFPKELY